MSRWKPFLKQALTDWGALQPVRWLHRYGLRILAYHHFSDASLLRKQCAHIRQFYRPLSLTDVAERLSSGEPFPTYSLAVTVDDGYRDFMDVAFPVFAEFQIPITVFLSTDFIDGDWLWFDRVLHAYAQSGRADSYEAACSAIEHAKTLPGPARRAWVENLLRDLNVECPPHPPAPYQALTWDEIRGLTGLGVEFGAHTKTHPILSLVSTDAELATEIAGSKAHIEEQLQRAVRHFCYPNGRYSDVGPRAREQAAQAGFDTAVTTEIGLNYPGVDPLQLLRICADPELPPFYFQRCLAGLYFHGKAVSSTR